MSVTVTVYLKPYVARYLTDRYGSPVKLPIRTQIKSIVLACITKKFEPGRKKFLRTLPSQVDLHLSQRDINQHGIAVCEQQAFFLNSVIEEKIKNEMFHVVSLKRWAQGKTISTAIREYQRENKFEEVWSEEAIRRAYYDIIKTQNYAPSSHNNPAYA